MAQDDWKQITVIDVPGGDQWVNMTHVVRMRETEKGTTLYFADGTRTMVAGTPADIFPPPPLSREAPEWDIETPDEAESFAVPPDIGPR